MGFRSLSPHVWPIYAPWMAASLGMSILLVALPIWLLSGGHGYVVTSVVAGAGGAGAATCVAEGPVAHVGQVPGIGTGLTVSLGEVGVSSNGVKVPVGQQVIRVQISQGNLHPKGTASHDSEFPHMLEQ